MIRKYFSISENRRVNVRVAVLLYDTKIEKKTAVFCGKIIDKYIKIC